jgi:Tfp pilus assembly protein PilF
MVRRLIFILALTLGPGSGVLPFSSRAEGAPLEHRPWFEVNTAHFNFYSCGPIGNVYKLAGRLEQFSSAYAGLAGAGAVASPPIAVMVFPDHASMEPFLPLYNGQPASLAAFFHHGSEENLIVLALPETGRPLNLEVIFHEYAHFLFRRNDGIWPLWLKEGMAEMYSTFETSGRYAEIGMPIGRHLRELAGHPMMPLAQLFSVQEASPEYNERDRQGVFYAESWLLTHFLMAGDVPGFVARFGQFSALLHQGQLPIPAFTNALGVSLPVMQAQLRRYFIRGQFRPIDLLVSSNLAAPIASKVRGVTPVEVSFRLGDELMQIGRLDEAKAQFDRGAELAPASPLPHEGLGLLADKRGDHDEALPEFKMAMARGSENSLVYYAYAREKYLATADAGERHTRLEGPLAVEIRQALQRSLALAPDFAPAHEMLGFFEMVQGDNLAIAGQELRQAIQLAPENRSYLIALAQWEIREQDPEAARQILQPLLFPNVAEELRLAAQRIIAELAAQKGMP